MLSCTSALEVLLFHDFAPVMLLWLQSWDAFILNISQVNSVSVYNHRSYWCLTTQLCWKRISVRHDWTNPVKRFLGWEIVSDIWCALLRLDVATGAQVLLSWWNDSLSRYHINLRVAAFGDYPRGALRGLGRTVIFRPIKSGVQVCGIIQRPWYFQHNNSLLPTLKIAGCWKSHYNHPSLQWKSLKEGGKITFVYKWGSCILPVCIRKWFDDFICPSSDKYRLLKENLKSVCVFHWFEHNEPI